MLPLTWRVDPSRLRGVQGLSALCALFALALLASSPRAAAEPWISPGDIGLRHDLQLLSDSGVISAPLTTWPLSWGAIANAVLQTPLEDQLDAAQLAALRRVQTRARRAMDDTPSSWLRVAAQERTRTLRTFEYTPREDVEVQGGWSWTGTRFAAKLTATVVTSPQDGQEVRADGSYGGIALGNWMLSVGQMDRWWGPGWNGSLILSSNARPLPAVSLDRNFADAFEVPVLRWLGPWTINTFMGVEEEDREVPNPLVFGFRFGFRPTGNLEIGLSRSAQWCGDGRRCDLEIFTDLLIGNDNRGADLAVEDEPGNQLAGLDFRWNVGGARLPVAVYGQLIGEDEAGGLPSRYLALGGGEYWASLGRRSLRVFAEYADTGAGVLDTRIPDYAYEHFIYRDGYRYFGRSLGHSLDNDSRLVSLGAVLQGDDSKRWSAVLQVAQLNRLGEDPNPVAAVETDYANVEVIHERPLFGGTLQASLGYERFDPVSGGADGGVKGFLQWQWSR